MRSLPLALVCCSTLALAQTEALSPPPPPVDVPEAAPSPAPSAAPARPLDAPEPVSPPYLQRCFSVPGQVWIPAGGGRYYFFNTASSAAPTASYYHAAQPVSGPGSGAANGTGSGSGSSSGGGGGSVDGKALLVLAVVALAVAPIILYAVDGDAPAVVDSRFHCPTFGFDAVGGVDLGERFGTVGAGAGRFTFGYGYFGSDFQFELSNGSVNAWSAHLMARLGPKQHLEPSFAFGFRSMTFGGRTRSGLEAGVPHRYVLWREGLRQLSVELRPTLMFGLGYFDAGLEAAVVIPLFEPLHLRVGGKVLSFGDDIIGGFNAGLTFTL